MRKVTSSLFVLLSVFVLISSAPVWGQTPLTSSTEASGSTGGFGARNHGSEEIGGWSFGSGGGSFLSMDKNRSGGTASMEGSVFGFTNRGADGSNTHSGANVRSQAQREGNEGEARIYGSAFQLNELSVNQGLFNVTLQNSSRGEYSQHTFGNNVLQGEASTSGSSGINMSPQHMNVWSVNGSRAQLTESRPNDDPLVQGEISLEVSRLYLGGGFTLLGVQGKTTYDASGPTEAHGYSGINSTNYALPFENGVAFGSFVTATSGSRSR